MRWAGIFALASLIAPAFLVAGRADAAPPTARDANASIQTPPLEMTGMRGSSPPPTVVTVETPALQMTGMRGATPPDLVVTVQTPPLEMTGMRGATPPAVAVTIQTPALEMTGLRGAGSLRAAPSTPRAARKPTKPK